MAEAKSSFEVVRVLQRRHLYKQPLEYLVKCRFEPGRCREKWIPQAELVALDKGHSLIREFKKTKVGQMGVDAYLGKRRSLARINLITGEAQQANTSGSSDPQPPSNHILSTVSCTSSSSSAGKSKNRESVVSKSNSHTPGSSHSSMTLEQEPGCSGMNEQPAKAQIPSFRFKERHMKSALSFSRNSFDDHKSKQMKNSSLRSSAPPFSGQKNFSQLKHTAEKNGSSESVQQTISMAALSCSSNNKFSISNLNEDDVVSVSSESSSEEVLYSLASERQQKTANAEQLLEDSSDLKRRHKDAGNPSKKLRVIGINAADSPESDSEVNFKVSASSSLKNHSKSSSKQGSTSKSALNQCAWNQFSMQSASQSLTDGPNFSSSKHRNTTSAGFDPLAKQRKKRNHANGEEDIQVERRISVRQTESAFRFKEIVVRKCSKYMHLVTLSQTPTKNAFNPKVFHELTVALRNAVNDDSHIVLLSASGNMFSSGIDIEYLLNSEDRRSAARNMATSLRDFINCLIAFPKPIVVAVNGPAIGLGMAILPLCDIIYASDKACFSCPYTALCQTPEGCSSYTFPKMMGMAMANELLFRGRKITALEAHQIGLITQVFWPDNLMSEVTPRVQHLAAQSLKAMENTKALIRASRRSKLECVNSAECQTLMERWTSNECQRAMKLYLDQTNDLA